MKLQLIFVSIFAVAVNVPALAEDSAPVPTAAKENSAPTMAAPVDAEPAQQPATDDVQKLGSEQPAPVSDQAAQPGAEQPAAETATAEQPDSSDANPPEISEAEKILWMGDQLKSIDKPMTLKYDFKKSGSFEEGFADTVKLHIQEILPDGMKNAEVDFFSGQHHMPTPTMNSINGNVLLALFLQGDILEMHRVTDIGSRYFQQKIKYALATSAKISDTEIEFNGTKVPGKNISITPYADDPKAETSEKYHKFKDKAYTFTISEGIPGYLYEIHTSVPALQDAVDQSQPLNDEVLRLTEAGPLDKTPVAAAGGVAAPAQPTN